MTKQYVVLQNYHPTPLTKWRKLTVVDLDEEEATPYIGNILTPLYTAIKEGIYPPPKESIAAKIIDQLTPDSAPVAVAPTAEPNTMKTITPPVKKVSPAPSPKKILENDLQKKILAAKAAKQKK